MAQSFVQLASDGTGKKIDTSVTATAAQHRQTMSIGDPSVDANVALVSSVGALKTETIGSVVSAVSATWNSSTTVNTTLSLATQGYGTVSLVDTTSGTISSGHVTFEVSNDSGTTWFSIRGGEISQNSADLGFSTATGVTNEYSFNVSGFSNFRVRLDTIIGGSGSMTLKMQGFALPSHLVMVATQQNANMLHCQLGDASNVVGVTALNALKVDVQPSQQSFYRAASGSFTPAATATDLITISGSATKTIRVFSIEVFMTATALADANFFLIKRSAANTGGTSTAKTIVPLDSNFAAGTAVVTVYTANPTALGAAVGTISTASVLVGGTTSVTAAQLGYTFNLMSPNFPSGVVLRGTSQLLALNFNGAAVPTGGAIQGVNIMWTEE
jgi:hypothetical protein